LPRGLHRPPALPRVHWRAVNFPQSCLRASAVNHAPNSYGSVWFDQSPHALVACGFERSDSIRALTSLAESKVRNHASVEYRTSTFSETLPNLSRHFYPRRTWRLDKINRFSFIANACSADAGNGPRLVNWRQRIRDCTFVDVTEEYVCHTSDGEVTYVIIARCNEIKSSAETGVNRNNSFGGKSLILTHIATHSAAALCKIFCRLLISARRRLSCENFVDARVKSHPLAGEPKSAAPFQFIRRPFSPATSGGV
jgi:hypothetical protein